MSQPSQNGGSCSGKSAETQSCGSAACGGNGKNVALLLTRGAEPGRKDEFGRTPMKIAAERGHDNLVQLLMAHSA